MDEPTISSEDEADEARYWAAQEAAQEWAAYVADMAALADEDAAQEEQDR